MNWITTFSNVAAMDITSFRWPKSTGTIQRHTYLYASLMYSINIGCCVSMHATVAQHTMNIEAIEVWGLNC